MSKFFIAVISTLMFLFYSFEIGADATGVSLSGFGSATIDGVISPGEWDNAGSISITVNVPEGGTTPGTLFVMNDMSNLYLAIRFVRAGADPGNTAAFEFDNDHSGGARVSGDDILLINPSSGFFDEVRTTESPCPPGALCGFFDTTVGGTNDGAGAFSNDGVFTIYEFSHPLDSADDTHDFSLGSGDTVGFTLFIRILIIGGFADTSFPTPCVACPNLFGDIVIASPFIPLDIDIKPGDSDLNCIKASSKGSIPVAILGNSIDVNDIDVSTIEIDDDDDPDSIGVAPVKSSFKDVNSDLVTDLVLHFETPEINAEGLLVDENELFVTGELTDGTPIVGSDFIFLVGGPSCFD